MSQPGRRGDLFAFIGRNGGVAVLFLFFLVSASFQWPGAAPYGSDNDEYLLVARTLVESGHFSVGDIHGTKYPPVVSGLLAVMRFFTGDPGGLWIVANHLFLLLAAMLCYRLSGTEKGGFFGIPAGLYLLANPFAWESVHTLMSDMFFLLLATAILFISLAWHTWDRKRLLGGAGLVVLATLTRSVGLVLSIPLMISFFSGRRGGKARSASAVFLLFLLPVVLLGAYMFYQKQFGPHPTGYGEMFFLADPYDASRGPLTMAALLSRTQNHMGLFLADVGRLTAGSRSVQGGMAAFFCLVGTGLVVLSCRGCPGKTAIVLAFALPLLAVGFVWPYNDVRFALPLLPLLALGVAETCSLTARRLPWPCLAIALALLGCYGITGLGETRKAALFTEADRTGVHASFREVADYCREHIPPDGVIASFDYRELALRLHRKVVPLSYSSDPAIHLEQMRREGVSWMIVSDKFYGLRGVYAKSVVQRLGKNAVLSFRNPVFHVYHIRGYGRTDPTPDGRSRGHRS